MHANQTYIYSKIKYIEVIFNILISYLIKIHIMSFLMLTLVFFYHFTPSKVNILLRRKGLHRVKENEEILTRRKDNKRTKSRNAEDNE